MSTGFKSNTYLIVIIGIILASGAGYVFGQSPIVGLENTISQIETENLALQSQVEELDEDNNDIQELLEATLANLSATQSAYHNLYKNFTEIQNGFVNLLTSYEEVKNHIEAIDFDNSVLLSLYSSLWENYADLIVAYNNLAPAEPIGEMVVTEIAGVVNGDFESSGNEGWVKQGKGGAYAFGGAEGTEIRSSLWQYPSGTTLTQTIRIDSKSQGLKFWVKPEPVGGEVDFSLSLGGYKVFSQHYQGIDSDFEWEKIVIPVKAIFELKETYGLETEGYYEIRFAVQAGEDNGAKILVDQVSLVEIDYQPEEPPYYYTEYLRNGDFDDPIIFDPDFNIPYWYEPGSGGSIGFSSSSGRTGRAIGLHPGKIIQKLDLPISGAILTFWILPNPNNEYSTIHAYFDDEIIYQNTFTGIIEDYDWKEVIIILDFVPGIHYLMFEVTTPNPVRIDDVSLVG